MRHNCRNSSSLKGACSALPPPYMSKHPSCLPTFGLHFLTSYQPCAYTKHFWTPKFLSTPHWSLSIGLLGKLVLHYQPRNSFYKVSLSVIRFLESSVQSCDAFIYTSFYLTLFSHLPASSSWSLRPPRSMVLWNVFQSWKVWRSKIQEHELSMKWVKIFDPSLCWLRYQML